MNDYFYATTEEINIDEAQPIDIADTASTEDGAIKNMISGSISAEDLSKYNKGTQIPVFIYKINSEKKPVIVKSLKITKDKDSYSHTVGKDYKLPDDFVGYDPDNDTEDTATQEPAPETTDQNTEQNADQATEQNNEQPAEAPAENTEQPAEKSQETQPEEAPAENKEEKPKDEVAKEFALDDDIAEMLTNAAQYNVVNDEENDDIVDESVFDEATLFNMALESCDENDIYLVLVETGAYLAERAAAGALDGERESILNRAVSAISKAYKSLKDKSPEAREAHKTRRDHAYIYDDWTLKDAINSVKFGDKTFTNMPNNMDEDNYRRKVLSNVSNARSMHQLASDGSTGSEYFKKLGNAADAEILKRLETDKRLRNALSEEDKRKYDALLAAKKATVAQKKEDNKIADTKPNNVVSIDELRKKREARKDNTEIKKAANQASLKKESFEAANLYDRASDALCAYAECLTESTEIDKVINVALKLNKAATALYESIVNTDKTDDAFNECVNSIFGESDNGWINMVRNITLEGEPVTESVQVIPEPKYICETLNDMYYNGVIDELTLNHASLALENAGFDGEFTNEIITESFKALSENTLHDDNEDAAIMAAAMINESGLFTDEMLHYSLDYVCEKADEFLTKINSASPLAMKSQLMFEKYMTEKTLKAKDKKALNDSDFGLPSLKKFPMPDESHVYNAIARFGSSNEVMRNPELKEELFDNIVKKLKDYGAYDRYRDRVKNDKNFAKTEFGKMFKKEVAVLESSFDLYPFHSNSPYTKEFSVGAMLPMMGSTKGFGTDLANTNIEDVVRATNNEIDRNKDNILYGSDKFVRDNIEGIDIITSTGFTDKDRLAHSEPVVYEAVSPKNNIIFDKEAKAVAEKLRSELSSPDVADNISTHLNFRKTVYKLPLKNDADVNKITAFVSSLKFKKEDEKDKAPVFEKQVKDTIITVIVQKNKVIVSYDLTDEGVKSRSISVKTESVMLEGYGEIDDDIKGAVNKLNRLGYKTRSSCSGHTRSRTKSDVYRDGIKYDKLYTTARIVFDKDYDIGHPKGWKIKKFDGTVGIYPDEKYYNPDDGMPDDAFSTWKQEYMKDLRNWVDSLSGDDKSDDEETEESVDDVFTEGANLHIREEAKEAKKAFKSHIKAMKHAVAVKDFDKANKEREEAIDVIDKAVENIRNIDSGVGSAFIIILLDSIVVGFLTVILTLITLPAGAVVSSAVGTAPMLYALVKQNLLQCKEQEVEMKKMGGKGFPVKSMNAYRNRMINSLLDARKFLVAYKEVIDNAMEKDRVRKESTDDVFAAMEATLFG